MEEKFPIIDILLQSLNFEVFTPNIPEREDTYTISYNSEWTLSNDNKMFFSSIGISFEGTEKDKDELVVQTKVLYFAALKNNYIKNDDDFNDEVAEIINSEVKPVILSMFYRDTNDLFTKSGYPPIRIHDLQYALK
ncbi:hypothetical protein B4O97_08890 [Marispirochaeta aestuarii]|uniref:Preprotein translocase subunit SecB n=1 Tax=Marispirochaeta aestuarii TaxID=1963862 RepID=A0A1Y1RYU9_9SPIO|nr:hypothetical protein [Marispirochaeta aestuarii]ORC35743.1 hypothetical protein B4O97_08890 [Marispirochaeta aestuarii]